MQRQYEPSYSIWKVHGSRVGITLAQTAKPILGYAFKNVDDTWTIECHGKIVPVVYDSLPDAARAILVLSGKSLALALAAKKT